MRKFKKVLSVALAGVLSLAFFAGCKKTPPGGEGENPGITEPSNPGIPEKPVDQTAPKLSGVHNVTLKQGAYFNYMDGVSARQGTTDISSRIKVSGSVNTAKAGTYTLTYTVTAENGKSDSAVRTVTVTSNEALSEVKPTPVYTTENSYNIARGCAVTATSTSNNSESKATDGDMSTRWESDKGVDDVTFTVDLGALLPVEAIKIYWEAAYATQFEILYSTDGADYLHLADGEKPERVQGTNNTYLNVLNMEEDFEARYLRIKCSERATAYGYSIYEFEAFGKKGTVVPTDVYPVLFDAQKDSSEDWAISDEQEINIEFDGVQSFDFLKLDFKVAPKFYEFFYTGADNVEHQAYLFNRPWSGETFYLKNENKGESPSVAISAKSVRIALHTRSFYAPDYRIADLAFQMSGKNDKEEEIFTAVTPKKVTATSSEEGHGIEFATDTGNGANNTYWQSARKYENQTIDLGDVKEVGRVDLFWRGDDGGKGKYYDLEISSDGEHWERVFRQTHGASQNQSVYVYESARYVRVIDYQNTNDNRYMLEGMVVNSQYPASSGEGKVKYDVSLQFPEWKVITNGNGTYVTGGTDFPASRLIAHLDESLRGKPIPSNDWWQGLLVRDYGYNMYMNPLTATYANTGLWLTNPGAGYYSGNDPGNGRQTINVDVHDLVIGYAGMTDTKSDTEAKLMNFSDYGISTVLTDNAKVDKFTAFLNQGSLYAYCYYAEPEKAYISANDLLGVYDLNGNEILGEQGKSYTGDCIIVCVRTHSGYKDDKEVSGEKKYEERYYIVNAPEGTQFIRGEAAVNIVMKNGNYLSVGAMSCKTAITEAQKGQSNRPYGTFDKAEAALMHEHGYAFIVGTSATYEFNEYTNEVTTSFRVQTVLMREGYSEEAYTAYLPHQLAKSDYDYNKTATAHCYPTVRGNCYSYVGNLFKTTDVFYGIVPTFAEPTDDGYEAMVLYQQLVLLYENNGGDKDPDSGLISSDPYWQGKNLHPMAMAALAADQIGATDLREAFLNKIEYILTDWFTYDPALDKEKEAYFYYDSEWGTLYYKNSEFGAGVNLADHYFTYGYYLLASGVLSAYRPAFAEKFGTMIELLIRDYMNPSRTDSEFPYMRNFDPFSGHGWAGGYADNDGGNNQESAGEALNSWVGAYLYATAIGDEEIRQAAIYGFTTELSAIKHYWFNYYGDFGEFYPFHCAGQVYGASNFFGTFFNGEPLYMYGIHLIPGEEFLTSYALNKSEQKMLEGMIDAMRSEQKRWDFSEADAAHREIYAWQHIFIPIVSIYDPDEAIAWYDKVLKDQGNVGNTSEQFNVYWLIHGMKSMGTRTTDIWAENGATATVYQKSGAYKAVCWNPTQKPITITFRNKNGVTGKATVPAGGLVTVDPTKVTTDFETYINVQDMKPANAALTNATLKSNTVTFKKDGKALWNVSGGTEEIYRKIVLDGSLTNAKLIIDGKEYALTKTSNGYVSEVLMPNLLTFKHKVEVRAGGGTLSAIKLETVALSKVDITGVKVTASSVHGIENVAENAVDGNMSTRWESEFNDNESLVITLPDAVKIYQLKIYWEAASAKEYKVELSMDGKSWTEVFSDSFSAAKRTDTVSPSVIMNAQYIKIQGVSRISAFGYSIYEVEVYDDGTDALKPYLALDKVTPASVTELTNATLSGNAITFKNGGSALWRVNGGNAEEFVKVSLVGTLTDVKLFIDGRQYNISEPVSGSLLSGRHKIEIRANGGTLTGITVSHVGLNKISTAGATVTASSTNNAVNVVENVIDGITTGNSRWESKHKNDDEWIMIELSEAVTVNQLKIYWEAASAKEYEVLFSMDGENWTSVFHDSFSSATDRTDTILPSSAMQTKYIKIQGISRTMPDYGYSLYEIELFNFDS